MYINKSEIINKFYDLTKQAEYIEANCFEQSPEPSFNQVLDFVIEHPGSREELGLAFIEVIKNPDLGSPELVQYCMHVLRWQELKDYLTDWLNREQSERVRHVLRRILEAFDDSWDGAFFYKRFNPNWPEYKR